MITLERVAELLGVKEMPGNEWQKRELLDETEQMVKRHGEQWIRENRGRLLETWQMFVDAT